MNSYSEIQRYDLTSTSSRAFPAPRSYWRTVVSGTHEAVDAAATLFGREGERMQWGRYRIVRVLEIPTDNAPIRWDNPTYPNGGDNYAEYRAWNAYHEGDRDNWRVR